MALDQAVTHNATRPAALPLASLHTAGVFLGGAHVLGPITLSVSPGETLALVGPSGIGKTTLLRVLAGLSPAPGAKVHVPRATAFVFQEPTLLPWRSVRDNLCVTTGCAPELAQERLAEVGLADKAALFPGQLSLGQQRRLSLARAFAAAPELLLLDEPFVSLDGDLVDEMMALFDTLRTRHKITSILVTHSEHEARHLATRIVALDGRPAEIVRDTPVP